MAHHQIQLINEVRNAIEHLAGMELSPPAWLDAARPYQLWTIGDQWQILVALDWLGALTKEWEARNAGISRTH